MSLRLYNSLTKREEEFVPRRANEVTMYTCGPTVYGRPHIGNYSSFLMADLLRRWLEVGHEYNVKHVKNITDVGHLVADGDDGADKVEQEARKENKDPLTIARMYTKQYLEDEKLLNMKTPFARPKATETIPEMLEIISKLIDKNHAYETSDGIYFSVETFPEYGKLSGNTLDSLNAGARIEVNEEKKHSSDFALWKKCVGGNANHLLRWDYKTGKRVESTGEDPTAGFPGWHIECSAMSTKFLGEHIDIHTGGEDNIFPHHECEIAQSESVFGAPFARYWLHRRFIEFVGENADSTQKMSKSIGNVYTITDILARGYEPEDLRYLLLSVHYRTRLKFSFRALDDAHKARKKIIEWMDLVDKLYKSSNASQKKQEQRMTDMPDFKSQFSAAMNADLNVSAALSAVFDAINWTYKQPDDAFSADAVKSLWKCVGLIKETFGCFESKVVAIPSEVQILLDTRAQARLDKDYARSDDLRAQIVTLGYEVRDAGETQVVKKI